MIDTRRLRFLCQLDSYGTMAATAESLNYSPSAVAQHIHALERELGVRLIEPAGRNVQLTPPARVLVEHARPIFAQLEHAEAQMAASLNAPQGIVRLAAFQTAAFTIIPTMIADTTLRYPQVTIEFAQGENDQNLAGLLDNRYDLVVFEQYPGLPVERHDDLTVHELADDPLWLIVPAAFADELTADPDPLQQVSARPWAMEPPGTHPRIWGVGLCQQAGFTPHVRFTTVDTLLHLKLVGDGLAVALIPQLALAALPSDAKRIAPFTGQLPPNRTLFTATRRSAVADPALVATRQALASAIQSLPQPSPVHPGSGC